MPERYFERELPQNYTEVYSIDAKSKKTGTIFTIFSLLIALPILAIVFLNADFSAIDLRGDGIMGQYFAFLAIIIGYLILHELTHGAVYKILTHEKLTFGISWSVAFCGVPNIYTYRRTALLSLLAPFTLFSVILLPLTIWLHHINQIWYLICGVAFALHISGCVGDLYMAWLFLTRFRNPLTLMRDTGPAQWLYVPEEFK